MRITWTAFKTPNAQFPPTPINSGYLNVETRQGLKMQCNILFPGSEEFFQEADLV